MTVIDVKHLTKKFRYHLAVDDISFEVHAGEIFGFLGPNGAGKTTTIRMLLGLVEPTNGYISVLGFDARNQADAVRAQTGVLLENLGLYETLSAEDNLEFYGRVWGIQAAERAIRIKELLSHIGMWERRNDPVGSWSRGMKQKLALTRALLHRPALVLLDEPTAGLDVEAAHAIREDLANLAANQGVTVFLTTHNMNEAENLCDRIAVIRRGRLVAVGNPKELLTRVGPPRVTIAGSGFVHGTLDLLGAQPDVTAAALINGCLEIDLQECTQTARLVSLLVNSGVQIAEVRRGRASLEEVYLTLMEKKGC